VGGSDRSRGAVLGLMAAVLFGMSAPLAKLLLPITEPLMLAALLYLGAGVGLALFGLGRRRARKTREAPIRRADLPWLVVITITGGIFGPLLLLVGLARVSGVVGSLLLNLKAVFTMLLAVVAFREHMNRREVLASTAIIAGAVALGYAPGEVRGQLLGGLAIAGACACWGLDNNLTQKLSVRDPVAIVRFKTLGAGTCSMAVALLLGQRLPSTGNLVAALILGLFSYGVSILLDAYALRLLGAAREAAIFATAPFVGALISVALLGDRFDLARGAGALFMAFGVWAFLRSHHRHLHVHEEMEHEHLHVHDDHHQHEHLPADPPGEPHSHPHRHERLVHDHEHVSDIHHRHPH
jgi:drug/metabolite transporter (DMT)-like permease